MWQGVSSPRPLPPAQTNPPTPKKEAWVAVIVTEVVDPEFMFKANADSESRTRDCLHATDVIRYVGGKSGLMRQYSEITTWDLKLAANCGFLWEDVIGHVLGEKHAAVRPGEITLDGVMGSPDGVTVVEGENGEEELALEEYKFTWKSCKNGIGHDWYYMTQCQAYMKLVDVTLCRFRVLYVMGDYKGSGPKYVEYLVRAAQSDVDANWRMLLNHKDAAWEWVKGGCKW